MYMILVYWLSGFVLAALLVVPFVMLHHAKGFAASAASDIRGS